MRGPHIFPIVLSSYSSYRKEVGWTPNTRLNAKRNEMSELNPQTTARVDFALTGMYVPIVNVRFALFCM